MHVWEACCNLCWMVPVAKVSVGTAAGRSGLCDLAADVGKKRVA